MVRHPPIRRFTFGIVVRLASCLFVAVPSVSSGQAGSQPPKAAPLQERDRLREQSQKLRVAGKVAEAIAAAEAAVAIERKVLPAGHPDLADSLDRLAGLYLVREDFPAARAARQEALEILRKCYGETHWKVTDARRALEDVDRRAAMTGDQRRKLAEAERLDGEVLALYLAGKYGEAATVARRVLALRQEVLGERHPDAAASLFNLGLLCSRLGDHAAARSLLERAVEARRALGGERHPSMAQALFELAEVRSARGDLDAALPLHERALALRKELLGERDPSTLVSMTNLGLLKASRGDYAAAQGLLERVLALRKEVQGEENADYAVSLNNLAGLYVERGDLDAALPLFERAVATFRRTAGEGHVFYSRILNGLAGVHLRRGDYAAARPLYERSLALSKQAQGDHSVEYAIKANNLAMLLRLQGDFAGARPLAERCLTIFAASLGDEHPYTLNMMNNLATVLAQEGEHARARALLEREQKVLEGRYGGRHPLMADCLNNLASVLMMQGDRAEARRMLERVVAIQEQSLGARHHDYTTSLNNLGVLLREMGEYKAARPLLERVVRIKRETVGDRHPDYAACVANLANLLRDMGERAEARRLEDEALAVLTGYVLRTLPTLAEREQLALLAEARDELWADLEDTVGDRARDGQSYRLVLAWKGLAAEAEARRVAASRPEVRSRLAALARLRDRLSGLYYARVEPAKADDHARAIRELTRERDALEAELGRALGWGATAPDPGRLAAALPPGSALVDLVRFAAPSRVGLGSNRGRKGARYAAFVVRPGRPTRRVDLGPSAPIDEALAAWRLRLRSDTGDADALGREVARRVWEPLAAHLDGAGTVLVAPDGDTCFLPWSALPIGGPGSYLLRRVAVGVVTSGRQVLALVDPEPAAVAAGLLSVGGVDYGRAEASSTGSDPARRAPTVALRSAPLTQGELEFGPLPGTVAEAEAVVALARRRGIDSTDLLSGPRATKPAVRAGMPGRRYLHLATHGYFAPPGRRSALAPDDDRTALPAFEGMGRRDASGWYPGLLSGLAWAGAARPPSDAASGSVDVGAGLMTAEEVSAIDLRGCELVVLSACETGLGRTAGGEGVLGLQRAFHQAGARTVVASLWKVDDEATRVLMTRFYANLWEKRLTPLESLRQAQLSILDDPDFGAGGDPRLWAAWTLSGDPGGLPRLELPQGPTDPARPEAER
jgi:CHAT domain-containing protein/tetratricopeptide (TPR) repeat protein